MKTSYWLANAALPHFARLTKNIKVDVAIVGAGIVGITAAYLLKRAGRSVALIERDRCCRCDTGHTTAHLTCVTDLRLPKLVKMFGRDHAKAVWDAGLAAIECIRDNVQREEISCDLRQVPGYLHAPLKKKHAHGREFMKEAKLARDLGFDATYVKSVPLFNRPGMQIANQAKFHPVKYLKGLLGCIPGNGSYVFENTEAEKFSDKPLRIKANGHSIECKYVVIATHVPLTGQKNIVSATLFQTKLAPYSSYAIGAKLPKGTLPKHPSGIRLILTIIFESTAALPSITPSSAAKIIRPVRCPRRSVSTTNFKRCSRRFFPKPRWIAVGRGKSSKPMTGYL